MSPRERTRALLREFVWSVAAKKLPVTFVPGVMHALRDLCARCYSLGRRDAHAQRTGAAPAGTFEATRYRVNPDSDTEETPHD